MTSARIAVIGAGPTGLACADLLARHGRSTVLFEKSRGIGGRVATRARNGVTADHGAQFLWLSADDDLIRRGERAACVVPWPAAQAPTGEVPWVGTPRMTDAFGPLLDGLDLRLSQHVLSVTRVPAGWKVMTETCDDTFDAAVLAMPAPQALRCLDQSARALRDRLKQVAFAACHAVMVGFEAPLPWPTVMRTPPDPFTLILCNTDKPGRPNHPVWYVAHTTPDWSASRLDWPADRVAEALVDAIHTTLGPLPPIVSAHGHRWGLAEAIAPLGAAYAASDDGCLLVGGDWTLGVTIGDALESGRAMARAVEARLELVGSSQ